MLLGLPVYNLCGEALRRRNRRLMARQDDATGRNNLMSRIHEAQAFLAFTESTPRSDSAR